MSAETMSEGERRGGRFARLYFAALLTLMVVLSVRDFSAYQFGFTSDSVEYAMLAEALVEGPRYALRYSHTEYEGTHFPFGYPMVLIPFVLAAPRGFEAAALLSLAATLSSVALLFLAWRWYVPEVDARWRYAVCAMFALAPLTLTQTRLALSEAIFTVLVFVALYFAVRVLKHPERRGGWVRLGIACFFMVFTRSIGLICLAALGFYLVVALRKASVRGLVWMSAAMLVMTGSVMALTPVTVRDLLPEEYLRWYVVLGPFRDAPLAPPTVVAGTDTPTTSAAQPVIPPARINPYLIDSDYLYDHLSSDLRRLVLLTGGGGAEVAIATRLGLPWLVELPTAVMLALLLAGAALWLWQGRTRGLPPVSLFMFVAVPYIAAVFFWRGGGERIWYTVQPHLYLAFLLGVLAVVKAVAALARRAAQIRIAPRLVAGAVGVVVTLWLVLAVYRDLTMRTSLQMWGDLRVRADVFDSYIEPDAVVASDWMSYDALYNRREMTAIPLGANAAEVLAKLQARGVGYVVAASNDTFTLTGPARTNDRVIDMSPYLRTLVAQGALTPVYRNNYPLLILRVRAASH